VLKIFFGFRNPAGGSSASCGDVRMFPPARSFGTSGLGRNVALAGAAALERHFSVAGGSGKGHGTGRVSKPVPMNLALPRR